MAKDDPVLNQPSPDPFSEAEQSPLPVAQTPFERMNSGSGISMIDTAVQRDFQQRQAQANLYRKNAADINGLLFHLADPEARKSYLNPQTGQPYTDSDMQELQSQLDHATGQYEKLVGVDKESKGALQKAKTIIDFVHGRRKAAMSPPPTPQYGATVTDNGVIPTPMPGANVGEAGVAIAPPAITPPPLSPRQEALRSSAQMPFATHQARVGQSISDTMQSRKSLWQQDIDLRTQEATKMGLDPNSREFRQYVATGSFPPVSRLTKMPYKDPKTGKILEGGYDGITGQVFDQAGNVVPNAEPANLASLTPKVIKYRPKNPDGSYQTGPDGQPIEVYGIQRGNQLFDQAGNELPEGTEAFPPAAFITKTTTGSSEKIDPLTGKREKLSSSRTTGPAAQKITGPGGYKPSGTIPGANPPPNRGGGQAAPTAPPTAAAKLPGSVGTRAQQDADREAAYLHRNNLKNLTGSTRSMIEAAPKVKDLTNRIAPLIDGLSDQLGPGAGRWSEFMAGKIGAPDPKYTKLRTDVGLLVTLLAKMHIGARGSEYIQKHFADLIDQGKQSPENMKAALEEISSYTDDVIQEGKNAGIDVTNPTGRPGGASPPPSPSGGGEIVIDLTKPRKQ